MSVCTHPHTVETADGEICCTSCAAVLDRAAATTNMDTIGMAHHTAPGAHAGTHIVPAAGPARRLAQTQTRIKPYRDVAYERAANTIRRQADKLSLPEFVCQSAIHIWRVAHDKGHTTAVQTAAALYVACRTESVPRSLDRVAAVAGCQSRQVGRVVRRILMQHDIRPPPPSAMAYVAQVAGRLTPPLHEAVMRQAQVYADDMDITGKSPLVVAAAAILLSCRMYGDRSHNVDSIATAAGVSVVATRSNARRYASHRFAAGRPPS